MQPQNSRALDVFLERASYDSLMRAREVGLKALEKGRPEKPLQELSSTDYMMWKGKFMDAAGHEGLTQLDILQEMPKWFSGPAKEIVETATIGVTEATAKDELTNCFRKMDTVFMAKRSNLSALFDEIVAQPKIQPSDFKKHFALSTKLSKAKKIAATCGESRECQKLSLIRGILNKRVPHLAVDFWKKDRKSELARGRGLSYDDLVEMIENWAVVNRSVGVEVKSAAVAAVTADDQPAPNSYNAALVSGAPKMQSTERCNVCGGMHKTEECHLLLNVEVDARVQKLASCRLCFHCFEPGHSAKGCAKRPTCATCRKQHATILHGRTYPKRNDDKDAKKGGERAGSGIPLAPFEKKPAAPAAPSATPKGVETLSPSVEA